MRAMLLRLAHLRARPPFALGLLVAALCIAVETALAYLLMKITPPHTFSIMYLLGIVVIAFIWGLRFGLVMALASAVALDYVLIPPIWGLRPAKITDLTVPAIFLTATLLTCAFSALARSLAVEVAAREEADLTADVARLLLRGPDLRMTLPAAARRLEQTLGIPSASIELGAPHSDEQHQALSLGHDRTLGALIIPTDLAKPALRRLRERVLPSLEVLLEAAQEREHTADALRTSRARVVAAADETRRRIERDLHDGTQHRLVSIMLNLHATQAAMGANGPRSIDELEQRLTQTAHDLEETLTELQELSRGVHPAIIAKGGLNNALNVLARRSPITVDLNLAATRRLPEPLEVTIYYVASEALTNAAKHAHASTVHIDLTSNYLIHLAIRDDGVGGADPSHGTGLTGLTDRIEALSGKIEIISPAGGGTQILIELPTRPAADSPTTHFAGF